MLNLMEYWIGDGVVSGEKGRKRYEKFEIKAKDALNHGYVEDYFRQWQTFMRGLMEEDHFDG
jgi:hypothetical protein